MPRDYAKQRVLQPSAKKKRGKNFFKWIFSVALLLVFGAMFWMFHHKLKLNTGQANAVLQIKTFFAHKKVAVTRVSKPVGAIPQAPEVKFDFYTELPNAKVTSVTSGVRQDFSQPLQPPTRKVGAFIIQVGIFANKSQASEARLSLLLNQLETEVVEFEDQGSKRYRLQRGGFLDMAQAKSMQKKFQDKGFETVIKKL